jgi:hypothetical protein
MGQVQLCVSSDEIILETIVMIEAMTMTTTVTMMMTSTFLQIGKISGNEI